MVLACISLPMPKSSTPRLSEAFSSEPSCMYTGSKDTFSTSRTRIYIFVSGFYDEYILCSALFLKRFLMILDSAGLEFRIRKMIPWATSVDGG